jgi:tRNA A37 N6-isopentenylltransferase MiaA
MVVGEAGFTSELTHGLAPLPEADQRLREELNVMSLDELHSRLVECDPEAARVDLSLTVAVLCASNLFLTGRLLPKREQWGRDPGVTNQLAIPAEIMSFFSRPGEHQRINQRVEAMFRHDVIEEVRAAGPTGRPLRMIGLREIHELLDGKISHSCNVSRRSSKPLDVTPKAVDLVSAN